MSKFAYSATKEQFIADWRNNLFVNKIVQGAILNRIGGSPNEKKSWEANAAKIVNLLELSEVPNDVQVVFEYKNPLAGRVDCMLFAMGRDNRKHIVHIELKQWSNDTVSQVYDTGIFKVEALIGGDYKIVPHPSQQALGYQQSIENYIGLVSEPDVSLGGHAYCYNYHYGMTPNDLYAHQYEPIMKICPLHAADQVKEFAQELKELLYSGKGYEVFKEFISYPVLPTKNLMSCAANIFKGQREFILLEDQMTSAYTIFGMVEEILRNPEKKLALIVKGGPGTGKTVIALQVIAELATKYPGLKAFFTTRSSALRDTLREKLQKITTGNVGNAAGLIRSIFDFRPANFKESEVDVLLIDEAHRIQKSANDMPDRGDVYTFLPQALSLIYTAKVCVFFIDDRQGIKSKEIGTSGQIKFFAENYGRLIQNSMDEYRHKLEQGKEERAYALSDVSSSISTIDVKQIELKTQFRCNGSDNYLDWLDDIIYQNRETVVQNGRHFGDEYQFQVLDSPEELEQRIRSLNSPSDNPNQIARIAAGWCWDWSKELQDNGDLKRDVVIGDWSMPWETQNKQARGPFRDLYAPSANLWASHPMGINQVGCIYSAQGFEVDYIGVILGPDITYDAHKHCITAIPGHTHSVPPNGDFETYIKNIYRVLLSRGRKGCFVYCCNSALANYIKQVLPIKTCQPIDNQDTDDKPSIVIFKEIDEKHKWITYLPFFEMRAACGYFGDGESIMPTGWIQVSGLGHLNRNMFIVRASGKSMEPQIHDGDYCVFRANPAGSRLNKIVLAQHRMVYDPDNGGAYSIKKYTSTKLFRQNGEWIHEKVVLQPLNHQFEPIEIKEEEADDFQIIGEYVGTISK